MGSVGRWKRFNDSKEMADNIVSFVRFAAHSHSQQQYYLLSHNYVDKWSRQAVASDCVFRKTED